MQSLGAMPSFCNTCSSELMAASLPTFLRSDGCISAKNRFNGHVRFRPIAVVHVWLHVSMMRFAVVSTLLLSLAACGSTGPWPRTPDARLVDQVEAKLPSVPCVGPMRRWERHYEYDSTPSLLASLLTLGTSDRWFNYASLKISYYQAGFEEFRTGRFRHRGVETRSFDLDDRDYSLVFGHFDIPTHKAHLWACGSNVGEQKKSNIVVR